MVCGFKTWLSSRSPQKNSAIPPPHTHTQCYQERLESWIAYIAREGFELSYLRMRKIERTGSCSFAEQKARRRTEAWTLPSYPFSSTTTTTFKIAPLLCVSQGFMISLPHHSLGNRGRKLPHPNPSQMQRTNPPTFRNEMKWIEREVMTQGQDGMMILVFYDFLLFQTQNC